MAKKITTLDHYDPIQTGFPDAKLKDHKYIEGEDDEPGSRIFAPYVQDILNVFHRTGRELGKFLNGSPDTQTVSQFFDWVAATMLHKGSNFYSATADTANEYELTRADGPIVYVRGLTARFVVPSDNTATTATINLFGIGALPLSDRFLETGRTPTLPVGFLKAGDVVDVMFDISDDDVHYFRIVTTPLNQLTEGQANIQRTVGDTVDSLLMRTDTLTLTEQVVSGVLSTTQASITPPVVGVYRTAVAVGRTVGAHFDAINERLRVYVSGGGEDAMSLNGSFKGINFVGGPNSTHTDNVFGRFTRIVVPVNQVQFIEDTSKPGNWQAFEYDNPSNLYFLGTDIPPGANIFFMSAQYYVTSPGGKFRNAACSFFDFDPSSPSNVVNFTIMSGDAPASSAKPEPNGASGYLHIHIWYDGAAL